MKFAIVDDAHCEPQGQPYRSRAEAIAELERRATIPWNEEPNRAPCRNWPKCGRRYVIEEYDDTESAQVSRILMLEISAKGVEWRRQPNHQHVALDSIQISMDPDPQVKVLDFVVLMKDFLDRRIGVKEYQRRYFELNTKRVIVSEEESKILQQAFGDADDFDEAVRLSYTIDEEQLRNRVSASLERLRMLGYVLSGP